MKLCMACFRKILASIKWFIDYWTDDDDLGFDCEYDKELDKELSWLQVLNPWARHHSKG